MTADWPAHRGEIRPWQQSVRGGTREDRMLSQVGTSGRFSLEMIIEAHAALMSEDEDPSNRAWAGRIREDQNWLGGSDHSPRNAMYVPPPPDHLDALLEDLIRCARGIPDR